MAHVQFCHPGINLRPLFTVLTLVHIWVSFHCLSPFRVLVALLAPVASAFYASLRVSVRTSSVLEPARLQEGTAGEHAYLRSGRRIRAATQASFDLLSMRRGRWDGTGVNPVHVNTLIAAGRAPRSFESKHAVSRSCLPCLPKAGALNMRVHFKTNSTHQHFLFKLHALRGLRVFAVFCCSLLFLCSL